MYFERRFGTHCTTRESVRGRTTSRSGISGTSDSVMRNEHIFKACFCFLFCLSSSFCIMSFFHVCVHCVSFWRGLFSFFFFFFLGGGGVVFSKIILYILLLFSIQAQIYVIL